MAHIAFYSTNTELPWGESEDLWSQAAQRLLQWGHTVSISYKRWRDETPAPLEALEAQGGCLSLRHPLWRRVQRWVDVPAAVKPFLPAVRWLRRKAPDLVIISVSYHTDTLAVAAACQRQGVPYALLLHCVSREDGWPEHEEQRYRRAYEQAACCFFVSHENRRIIEEKITASLPQATVVSNPLGVRPDAPLLWPSDNDNGDENGPRFACVGQMHFRQKAQDVILRVLRRDKWRNRSLQVRFFGSNQGNRKQFEALIRRYGLEGHVRYAGYAERARIWRTCHGLLLPSRFEGMPMVTPEAMACGRVPVVTRCGRNPDLVTDGETGFLAEAATERLVDRALERAWQRRAEWEQMGRRAAQHIRESYDDDPVGTFAQELLERLP
jgi:glycosyltransferase involved in cell wall biosynthesis